MGKIYLEKDVLTAAKERIAMVLKKFDNVYFSFSGGKDSSVMLQLANKVAGSIKKKFDVLFIDLEAQYEATIEHVEELKGLNNIRDFYHIALPLSLRNSVSVLQPKWVCWDEDSKDLWVRELPENSINIRNNPIKDFRVGEEFEEFILQFAQWYQKEKGGICACGVAIRANESLNRFRTVANKISKIMYEDIIWTTRMKYKNYLDVYNFYPIYDFTAEDIWGTVSKLKLKFNKVYEMLYKDGISIHQQRLCQPYGDDQRNGLNQFKKLEPQTWEKVLNRVNGVNFGNIYCRTTALGNLRTSKPNFMTWQEYTVFLLESTGLYNEDLMVHYYQKIKKFMLWYNKKEGKEVKDIPDEADIKLEGKKKVISWRRIARSIEKNDFYMRRLSFSQTKGDEEKLKRFMNKYTNFLTSKTDTDYDLIELAKKEGV
ncbi:MAG: DUF3440 domain-containing protein [Clostridia bacterium]|nr:DUF3440 domain-containing protein [Clostridia bacterium]